MLVLATSTLLITTREEAVETTTTEAIKTIEAGKNGKDSKSDEYLENLV